MEHNAIGGPCCSHLRVEYRTEDVRMSEADAAMFAAQHDPASAHVPPRAGELLTRGWWECASGCGTEFVPTAVDRNPQLGSTDNA